ncbi:MAG: RNA 2'-phosphotransferase [Ktedonobacteraceae bacterium]|nr:RNA 2'-phosphotransferase [Ktedonobacteraceae bacterium]
MQQDLVQLSRTMSYALRHAPSEFGLELDTEGWVSVQHLLNALRRRRTSWRNLDASSLEAVIAQSEKRRFEMRDGRIRAYYGHSLPQKMEKKPDTPPAILYHGTTPEAAATIREQGLKPMRRQYVHLSADLATARQVALRRTSRPVILHIEALQAHRQGVTFYLGNDMVWLADNIAPRFIHFDA